MTLWQEYGQCKVSFRDNSTVSLKRTMYPIIVEQWKRGGTFIECEGIYGHKIAIKLAEVNCILDCSPEAIKAEADDSKEYDRQQAIS